MVNGLPWYSELSGSLINAYPQVGSTSQLRISMIYWDYVIVPCLLARYRYQSITTSKKGKNQGKKVLEKDVRVIIGL